MHCVPLTLQQKIVENSKKKKIQKHKLKPINRNLRPSKSPVSHHMVQVKHNGITFHTMLLNNAGFLLQHRSRATTAFSITHLTPNSTNTIGHISLPLCCTAKQQIIYHSTSLLIHTTKVDNNPLSLYQIINPRNICFLCHSSLSFTFFFFSSWWGWGRGGRKIYWGKKKQ